MTTASATAAAPRTVRPSAPAGLIIGTARLGADVEAAAELLRRQLRWLAALCPSASTAEEELARLRQPEEGVRLVLARRGGRPVGVARARYRCPAQLGSPARHSAKLTHLFVVPEARGAGVGEALVGQAAVMAWWFGSQQLTAAPATWTSDAVRLLQRVGMQPIGGGLLALDVEPSSPAR